MPEYLLTASQVQGLGLAAFESGAWSQKIAPVRGPAF